MKSQAGLGARRSRRRTARLTATAAAVIAVAAGGAAAAAARAATPVIGSVTTAAGVDLYVKRAVSGTLTELRRGTVLYLGDVIAAGPGTHATVRLLASDSSLPPSDDLISVSKQLASGRPAPVAVVKEFGVAADTTREYTTIVLRRSGNSLSLTLER